MPFKVTYLWNTRGNQIPQPGEAAQTYTFASKKELNAFKQGVEEAAEWASFREAPEGYVVPIDGYNSEEMWWGPSDDGGGTRP